jgi:GntR family transcriptional regulator
MFHVRPESGEPIYQQLVRQITHAITTGAVKPGERLPTVRDLAAELVVNPNTVARAYRELDQAGLVESGPRKGTFVKFAPPAMLLQERRKRLKPHIDALIAESRVLGFSAAELRAMIDKALARDGE